MTKFLEAVDRYGRILPDSDPNSTLIFDAIRRGFEPFRPREIKLFVEYDIDHNRYRIYGEAHFPGYFYPHSEWIDHDQLIAWPSITAFELAEKFFDAFRYRPILLCAPLIYLGDN